MLDGDKTDRKNEYKLYQSLVSECCFTYTKTKTSCKYSRPGKTVDDSMNNDSRRRRTVTRNKSDDTLELSL